MDEELAKRMNREETQEPELPQTPVDPDELDEELQMVLKLSAMEAQQNGSTESSDQTNTDTNTSHSTPVDDTDRDYAFALQLQNDLQSEQLARQLQERENSSIHINKKNEAVTTYYGRPLSHAAFIADQLSEEDESDESEEEIIIRGQKPHHQAVKPNGRSPVRDAPVLVTKHDLAMAARKNADNVEKIIQSGSMENVNVSNPVYNSLAQESRRQQSRENQIRGNRADRSTSEQVLDQKTRIQLLNFLNSSFLQEINGVVNTGKEANVYHAIAGSASEEDGTEYAVKIFKTTLNEFKNRAEYVEGEFRFRRQTTQNSQKLIKLWAEKEMRNLKRLHSQGVMCPQPVHLKDNILIMHFIGKDGWPAPLLKDTNLSLERYTEIYHQIVHMMRKMFHDCKLVHGDLSEYNILYYDKQAYIIDVSQSVEHDHPKAFDFLRKDCECIVNFFSKKGVQVLKLKNLFEFITDVSIRGNEEETLSQLEDQDEDVKSPSTQHRVQVEDAIFKNEGTYLPRSLKEVTDNSTVHRALTNGVHNTDEQ
eukprot:TRINITY_DN4700_c0_g1_i1.p1 TRINITY_DN4700_c0_g1~~TRINITY_DN4700_c0_g1_i1.p1  ORF type:complete len:584 (+),score=182.04 TRINITY_DN4700_c0_g1_i1:145-1752(+)